ncbi:hypothetical protein [Clostridium algidicarnis]|uniref:hypothetical protein n=1 Tax=Clostridium algidicarnis TaxID=37659 RepID=UPI001C0E7143|nr:hypothetical protein [Clostridium algidicarnis]MBU3228911.1 hypothetical protein [Clostridium algidicarnis]MBU3252455.1 hypothetical protein [Clostridium algidicarnis]
MNKRFMDDQYISFINTKKIQNVLKFYQSTVSLMELYEIDSRKEEEKIKIKAYDNYFDIPESYVESIPFDALSDKERLVIDKMNNFFNEQEYVYILPIFIFDESKNIPSGIYSIDFMSQNLYKYKELNKKDFKSKVFEKGFNICICYFIDLNESIFLDGEAGFINGAIQIGKIYENIEWVAKENEFHTYSEFVSQQSFAYNLGINCRTQLFIKNQFLKES